MDLVGKKALKAGTWYTICTFILKGLSFITMPLFTRILSVSDIGMYSNLTSWITILGGIVTLDLYTSINIAHYQYDEDLYQYMASITIAGSLVTLVCYGAAMLFSKQIVGILGITEYMLHIMFLYFLVNPAILILHAKFRIYLQYRKTIITSLLPAVLSVITALIFVLAANEDKLRARIFGYYGVWIAFAIVIYLYILCKGRRFKSEYIKFALSVSVPLIIHTFANTILSTSDRVMIQKICGSKYTAYYSIANSCALLVSILWSSVNQAWAPWCFEMMHREKEQTIGKVAKPILLLFSMGVLLLILVAPEILYVLGGEAYMQAIYVVPPVMLGYIAQMLYTLYVNIEYYHKKQKQIMIGTLIAAVVNIVLNIIFIPVFGYISAAYTTLAGYIVLLFIHYAFVKRMKLDSIYDMKFNIMLLSSMMVFGIGISVLYNFKTIRLFIVIFLLMLALIVILKRREALADAIRKKDFVEILRVLHLMERNQTK